MALSFVEYVGNGTQTDFAFSFGYISPSHVKVTVNGVDTPFTFFSTSTARVTPAPANGTTVRVARITPEAPLVNFVDGSTLTEADLDISTLQAIYLAQEAVDKSAEQAGSVTASQITDASANARQLITAANFAAMKTLLAITASDISNASTDGQSLITATNFAAMRTLLGFTSANISDASSFGRNILTAASYAAMKTLLAITAADITNASADGRALITATNYAAMRTALGLTAPATASFSTNAQATAGLDNTTVMTPLRTAEAIAALAPGGGGGGGSATTTTFSPAGNIAATNVQAAIVELDNEKAAVSHTHTANDISDASANGRSLITAANYAAMKTLLAITASDVSGLTAPATASFATNAQATAGTDNTTVMTPLRTAQAITALAPGGGAPAGTIVAYAGKVPPSGWLLCDGSNQSRTTLATLFNVLCPVIGTFTITIASPGVITLNNHGLATGDRVRLSTTGALPTGLDTVTDYFVSRVDNNTFRLRLTQGGADINTSGTQSGVHTAQAFFYGSGDGSTTFGIPDLRGRVPVGSDSMGSTSASRVTSAGAAGIYGNALGSAGGGQDSVLTTAQLASHSHNVNLASGGTSGSPIVTFTPGTQVTTSNITTATAGSGQAHSNMQPSLITSYIIKT